MALTTSPYIAQVAEFGFSLAEILHEHAQLLRSISRQHNAVNRRREEYGHGYTLLQELKLCPSLFKQYMRLDFDQFQYVLDLVGPIISKNSFNPKEIPAEQGLAITLRHLGDGDSISCLAFSYRIGLKTCRDIVRKTVKALVDKMQKLFIPDPNTNSHWYHIAQGFLDRKGLAHCLGALDGRLFRIKKPKENAKDFYCYKKFYAIIFMALVAADCTFIMADIGSEGSLSDSTVLSKSLFWNMVEQEELGIPAKAPLPGAKSIFPYYFVGDGGFKLQPNLMKPYRHCSNPAERNFNRLLCSARVVAEHAFGILVGRWRIFEKALTNDLDYSEEIILATVCLHNMLIRTGTQERKAEYLSDTDTDFRHSPVWAEHKYISEASQAAALRDKLKDYLQMSTDSSLGKQ